MKGIIETGTILDRIVADKRKSLQSAMVRVTQRELESFYVKEVDGAWTLGDQWRLQKAVVQGSRLLVPNKQGPKLVCEIKVASPSKGRLVPHPNVSWVKGTARAYTEGGACAISVLTEGKHFLGKLSYMKTVRHELMRRFPAFRPSILRKDFLFTEYQIWESRANGADAVLLIAAILEEELLKNLIVLAYIKGMDALVEVHDEAEVEKALRAGATIIGINNRDLKTENFHTDLAVTERLRPYIPDDKIVVSESGIHTRDDVERLAACGVHAILVGESLVTASDIHAQMKELTI